MNHVLIEGRSGADAELRFLPTGTAVMNLSVAHTEKRADAFETHWLDIVVFGKYAESLVTQIQKGTKLVVEGKLQSRSWKDKANRTQKKVEILAASIRVIAPAKTEAAVHVPQGESVMERLPMVEDEIPF